MNIAQIVGVIASIVGVFAVVFTFRVYSKFMKELKTGFAGIAFGILSGYLAILAITLHAFRIVDYEYFGVFPLIFLSIAAILIAFGSNKILKVLTGVKNNG